MPSHPRTALTFKRMVSKFAAPRLSSNPDFAGGDLPDLADCGIDDGFVAAAVRRAFSLSDVHRDLRVWNAAVPPR